MNLSRSSLLTLLVILNIINMIDRNLLSSFGPQITEELELSDSQFALLTGFGFVFFYVIMGLFMGSLADKVNRPRLIAAGLFLWSLLTVFSGMAKNFVQIGIARLFIGVGESALTPASMSLLSDVFPAEKRGKVAGIYYLGVPLGAGGSFLVAGILGPVIGWRNCFYLLGAIGIALSLLLVFIKEVPRGATEQADNQDSKSDKEKLLTKQIIKDVWHELKSSKTLMYTILGAVLLNVPLGAGQLAPIWLVRERGLDVAEITTLYGLLFLIFGTIGVLLGGVLSDWYQRNFNGGRSRFLAIFMLFITPLTVSYRYVSPDNPLFYIGMSAGFVSVLAYYGPVFSTVQNLTPARLRGSMTAVVLLAINIVGIGFGALMVGVLSDYLASIGFEQTLTIALVVGDAIAALAVVCFFLASRGVVKSAS